VGIAAQVKLLPMLYFFSFLGLLLYLQPSLREVAAAFVVCGMITYAVLVILWVVVPKSWYSGNYALGTSPLFTIDSRGARIRMSMYFGIIVLFYCYRCFLRSRRLVWLLGAAVGFLITFGIVKTRAMIVGIAGVLIIDSFVAARPVMRLGLMVIGPLALVGLFSFDYLGSMFSTSASSGFDVRWITVTKALGFLGLDPIRWTFGVGTISPISSDSLFAYFSHAFFLSDITWLGILFEYGIIGTILLLMYEIRGLLFFNTLRKYVDSDFLGSLFDYILYILILAIFAYTWYCLQAQDPAESEAD
jgi:hypothetical protein